MAISNFIPAVWSEALYTQLEKKYIAAKHCNREYEGDIRGRGSSVKICGVGKINVFDYTKNTDMENPQTLSDHMRELVINQAKGFNFQIDDIDRAQSMPNLMEAAMKVAADALANEADAYIYSLHNSAGTTYTDASITPEKLLNYFIEARTTLHANGVSDASDIIFEVTPEIGGMLLKAKLAAVSDNTELLETGSLGSIAGCRIYVSKNVCKDTSGDVTMHKCFARTTRAIAYAEQLSEINAYRPEKRFADAVKGLHLYGAKVVYPSELVVINVGSPNM